MRIELICIGTELLRGKVNTHGAAISTKLSEIGAFLTQETTVSDAAADMERVFRSVFQRSDVILTTGGLGPTFDDLTREIWSKVLGIPLRRDVGLERDIRRRFTSRRLRMPPENSRQADVLEGAQVLRNTVGTAPGQVLETSNKVVALLPGPGPEMIPMLERVVIPILRRGLKSPPYGSFTLHTFGKPESYIDEKIRPVIERVKFSRPGEWVNFCILAHSHHVDVKVEARAPRAQRLESILNQVEGKLERAVGRYVYGRDDEMLESVVGSVLSRRRLTLALAESCTGGLLSEMITRVPGSSRYFLGSFVTYSNDTKRGLLGVRQETLDRHGAVSAPVALEMARGVRAAARSSTGLSITGIAGPTGGTSKKPVGLVFIGFAGPGRSFARKFLFHGTREDVRQGSAMTALDLLRRELIS